MLGLSPKEGDGKRIDAAERTDHGGVAQRCQSVCLIAEIDAVELDGEDGEEEEKPPFQKAGKEGKTLLRGKCAEEKGEAEERERGVPIHRADGHLAHADDLADVEVEDEEQEEIDGEEEIEEQLLRGGGELIACVRTWQCAEKCGKSPAAVCDQTGEEIGRLGQPSVRIGDDQCPECGDTEDEPEREQDARHDGKGGGKEKGGKPRGFVCSFEEKERKEGECEIDALRSNDQMAARIFHAIPRIGKEEEQDGRRCRMQQQGFFHGKYIREEAEHDRHHPCAEDGGGEAYEMLEIVAVPTLRIQIGAQQDNACTDEEKGCLPKDGDGETADEFMRPSLQLQDANGDIHSHHPLCDRFPFTLQHLYY